MNKNEFIERLKNSLCALPEAELCKTLDYYSEIIDDMIEDGMEEGAAVASLGDTVQIANEVLLERPLAELVKSKVNNKRSLKGWQVALIILGSPLWLILILSVLIVILSFFIVLWSILLALFAVVLSLAVSLPVCVFGFALFMARQQIPAAILILGVGLICGGFSIFGFMAVKRLINPLVKLGKWFLKGVKSIFISKEAAV